MPDPCVVSIRWIRILGVITVGIFSGSPFLRAQERNSVPTGTIAGHVVATDSGELVAGATVHVSGTDRFATTDLNGAFRFERVREGDYELEVARDGFRPSIVADVRVISGITARHNVPLEALGRAEVEMSADRADDEVIELEALTVEGEAAAGSTLVLLGDRQKAPAISDAIGEDDLSRYAVSDAADAMTKVTGASLVGGKYVLIRGLGDRYSNTLLNGITVPSADPDRRAVQMDQFPASVLESIVTSKSFTADQPGGFSGGSVNLRTKSFPEQRFLSGGFSFSYNPRVAGEDLLMVPGGGSDWLARDDGTRSLPNGLPERIPSQTEARSAARRGDFEPAEELDRASKLFHNDAYYPGTTEGGLNYSSNISFGDRYEWSADRRFGYIVGLTYGRTDSHLEDADAARFSQGSVDPESPTFVDGLLVYSPELDDYTFADAFAENPEVPGGAPAFGVTETAQRVDWSAYAQVAYTPSLHHEFVLRYLHNQSADDRVKRGVGESTRSDGGRLYEIFELLYTERTVSSLQLTGESLFPAWNDVRVEWRASHSRSTQDQPDYRSLSYFWDFANQQYAAASGVGNNRFFRDLTEDNDELGADVFIPLLSDAHPATLKIGGVWQDGGRVYRERRFRWSREANNRELIENYPNPVGIVARTENSVTFGNTISELPNNLVNYDGEQAISAAYAQLDLQWTPEWRVIAGVRGEQTRISTSPAETGTPFRAANLDETDVLPALSVIRELRPGMNLRAAYGRTLARPLYRELADIRVEDAFNDEFFAGNPDLVLTTIDNFDLRWEWFFGENELVAASAFYKRFQDPIELITESGAITPRNLQSGEVKGVEFETRFGLGRFGRWGEPFSIGGNLALIDSSARIPADELAIIRATFPDASDTRELNGQSPYVLNFDLTYHHADRGTTITAAWNVVGERLALVTPGPLPDVFEQPGAGFDLLISQRLSSRWRLKFAAKNLFDAQHQQTLTHGGTRYFYERHRRGREFTLGLSCFFE